MMDRPHGNARLRRVGVDVRSSWNLDANHRSGIRWRVKVNEIPRRLRIDRCHFRNCWLLFLRSVVKSATLLLAAACRLPLVDLFLFSRCFVVYLSASDASSSAFLFPRVIATRWRTLKKKRKRKKTFGKHESLFLSCSQRMNKKRRCGRSHNRGIRSTNESADGQWRK